MRKSARVPAIVSLTAIFAALSPQAFAQQQPAAGGAPAAGAVINPADAELKSTIITFQADFPVARHEYYWWQGACYYRNPSGKYAPVAANYCTK